MRNLSRCVLQVALVATSLVVVPGCTSYGPWKASPEKAILISGQPAKSVDRTYVNNFMLNPAMGATSTEFAWADARDHKHTSSEITINLGSFIQQTDIYRIWAHTGAFVNSVEQRLAPFTLTLVSVNPTVVIMQPHDYGRLDRSINAIVGEREHALSIPGLLNHLYYGTQLPPSSDIWWFSPDLNQKPERLFVSDGNTVVIPKADLCLIRVTTGWRVEAMKQDNGPTINSIRLP